MPRGFTENEKQAIGELLVSKGRNLFGRYGYEKTSIDKIVDAAGIAKGSFYKFYPNKEVFYLSCLADLEEEMEREVIGPLIDNAQSAEELLNGLIDLAMNGFGAYPLLRSWFETPSRERILSFLDEAQRTAMDSTDLVRMGRVRKRLKELGREFRGSDEDLTALFRALFLMNGQKTLISDDFTGFSDLMKSIIREGALL